MAHATIFHGDAFKVLTETRANTIDAIVTDPPYAVGPNGEMLGRIMEGEKQKGEFLTSAKGGHSRGYADADPRALQVWHKNWLEEAWRVLKPGGHLVAFSSSRMYHRLAVATEDVGFEIRDCIQWIYGTGLAKVSVMKGDHAGWATTMRPAHEPAVLARKRPQGTVVSNMDLYGTGALNVNACRNVGRWPPNVVFTDPHLGTPQRAYFPAFAYEPKASKSERGAYNDHPTVKPLALMQWLVRLVTPTGGVVLDPFCGSGSTGVAALREGMRFVGIEQHEPYVKIAEKRMKFDRPLMPVKVRML